MSWVWRAAARRRNNTGRNNMGRDNTGRDNTGRDNDRGAILPIAAVAIVLACICAALAVDIGFLAQDKRTNQKVADLAALDAVRDLSTYQTRATQSATRNGFVISAPKSMVTARRGALSAAGVFTVSAVGPSVEVTVISPRKPMFPFVGNDERTITAVAVANAEPKAGFTIGSKLATFSTAEDKTVLNRIFGGLLGVPAINGSILSYQGLAATTLSLGELAAADVTLGTPEQILASTISVKELVNASAAALGTKGDAASVAAKTFLLSFVNSIDSSLTFKVGDLIAVQQPADPGAAAAQFNVYDLINGSAELANKNNTISIPDLRLGIPGVLQADLRLHVIEGPQYKYGVAKADLTQSPPWATVARTAQVGFDFDLKVTAGVLTMTMPIRTGATKATGALTQITCASPTPPAGTNVVNILAATEAVSASAATTVTAPLLTLGVMNATVNTPGSSNTLTFTTPPLPTAPQSTAANGTGLSSQLTTNLSLLGLSSINVGLLTAVTDVVDSKILDRVFRSAGLSFSGADVIVSKVDCLPSPSLVK